MPKFSWSPDYLASLAAELIDGGKVLLCLSPVSFRLAADMSEMLLWPTRYGLQPGDEVPELGRVAYREINNYMCLQDYSAQLENIASALSQISVSQTVNVGGATCQPTTLYCVSSDGEVIPTPQIPPSPTPIAPNGATYPMDPYTQPPPTDYDTWADYDQAFCIVANALVQTAVIFLNAAETLVDVVATAAAAIVLLTPLLPAAVITAVGGFTIWQLVYDLVQIVASEQASDILAELATWLTEEREAIVCKVYSYRYTLGGLPAELASDASAWVEDTLSLSPAERNPIEGMVATLFSYTALAGMMAAELDLVDAADMVDCSLCGQVAGLRAVPVSFGNVVVNDFDGYSIVGNQISATGQNHQLNSKLTVELDTTAIPLPSVLDGSAGARAIMCEVIETNEEPDPKTYLVLPGVWASNLHVMEYGERLSLRWKAASGQLYLAPDLAAYESHYGLTGVYGQNVPGDYDGDTGLLTLYTYQRPGPFTVRLWWLVHD